MKKDEMDKKKDLLLYLDGAIEHLNKQIDPLRDRLKKMIKERTLIQNIRKAIK